MSLTDPGHDEALREHRAKRAEILEAKCRKVMAQRVSLVGKPGTHGLRADLLGELDYWLDEVNQIRHSDGQATAPHA